MDGPKDLKIGSVTAEIYSNSGAFIIVTTALHIAVACCVPILVDQSVRVTGDYCLFLKYLYSDNLSLISHFRSEGGFNKIFRLCIVYRKVISFI